MIIELDDYLVLKKALGAMATEAGTKMGYETVKEIARDALRILNDAKPEPHASVPFKTYDKAGDEVSEDVARALYGIGSTSARLPIEPTLTAETEEFASDEMPAETVPERSLEIPSQPIDYYIERIWRILDEEPAEAPVPMAVKAGTLAALYQAKALQDLSTMAASWLADRDGANGSRIKDERDRFRLALLALRDQDTEPGREKRWEIIQAALFNEPSVHA